MSCEYCVIHVQHYSRALECDVSHNFCWNCGEPLTEPKPLTLEQLREMDGEPVWVNQGCNSICRVIRQYIHVSHNHYSSRVLFTDGEMLFICKYGLVWNAYTHKPKDVR